MAYRGKYPNRIKEVSGRGKSGVVVWTNAGERFEFTARDTGGIMPKPGEEVERYLMPKKNPAPKRKTAARTQRAAESYVRRPSQITKAAPSKRLKTRRTKNLQVPRGVFPNPSPRMDTGRVKSYNVYIVGDGYESYIKGFKTIKAAKEYIASIDTDRIYRIRPVTLVSMLDPIFEGNRRDFKVKKNPDSVHFDIDVNSHNARGSRAKTRVNPAARKKEITVEQSLDKKHWTIFARFPDTPNGSADAIEYAKAYSKKEPYLHIRVMTK